MYRDIVVDEMRIMALVIAKLMGLKADGKYEEYQQQFNKALQQTYNTEPEELLNLTEADFIHRIQDANYSVDKLNALGQMLVVFAQPFKDSYETRLLLKKVILIFDLLEQKYHYQSFENIQNRKLILQYFKVHQP